MTQNLGMGANVTTGPFTVRLVDVDYYMAAPIPGVDVCYSALQGSATQQVKAKPYYGYHTTDSVYIKVVLYNPASVTQAAAVLQSGVVMGVKLQPHESHIPYLLQMMVDHNLRGMEHVRVAKVKFRPAVPVTSKPASHGLIQRFCLAHHGQGRAPARQTKCELEADAEINDVQNRRDPAQAICDEAAVWQDVLRLPLDQASPEDIHHREAGRTFAVHELVGKELVDALAVRPRRAAALGKRTAASHTGAALADRLLGERDEHEGTQPKSCDSPASADSALLQATQAANSWEHAGGTPVLERRDVATADSTRPLKSLQYSDADGEEAAAAAAVDEQLLAQSLSQPMTQSKQDEKEMHQLLEWLGQGLAADAPGAEEEELVEWEEAEAPEGPHAEMFRASRLSTHGPAASLVEYLRASQEEVE
eukprot:gene4571-5595_t